MSSHGLSAFFIQGHADPDAVTTMLQIDTLSNHSVSASLDHYFPLVSGKHVAVHDLSVGDELWVQHEGTMVSSPIVRLSEVTRKGLFNPYTLAGDIFVNEILASSHSSWFLEETGLSDSSIVAAYKFLFYPLSLLHHLKPSAFPCFHNALDDSGPLNKIGTLQLASTAITCLMDSSHGPRSFSEHVHQEIV